jgi:hypothetical protein
MIELFTALLFGIFVGGLLFHEAGHYVTARVFGYHPSFSLKKFAVGFTDDLTRGRALIILAGVLVQSGFVFGALYLMGLAFLGLVCTVALLPMGVSDFHALLKKSPRVFT